MSRTYIPKELRRKVADHFRHRCAYCQSAELVTGGPMEIDHILPETLRGATEEANLCLCCTYCNDYKSNKISALDPLTNKEVHLFNPRTQSWPEHFEWSTEGDFVKGKTPTGRATVLALQLNRAELVASRQLWVKFGIHPTQEGTD